MPRGKDFSETVQARAKTLVSNGLSYCAAGKTVGASGGRVREWCIQAGVISHRAHKSAYAGRILGPMEETPNKYPGGVEAKLVSAYRDNDDQLVKCALRLAKLKAEMDEARNELMRLVGLS